MIQYEHHMKNAVFNIETKRSYMKGRGTEIHKYCNDIFTFDIEVTSAWIDENGKITDFTTTLTGELIASTANGTILKDSFSLNFDSFDKEYLIKGFDFANEYGINEALFKTRILKNLFNKAELEAYSFFLGACLSGEVVAIKNFNTKKVVIGGKRQLKRAIYELLLTQGFDAVMLSDAEVDASVVKGQIKIYEYEE